MSRHKGRTVPQRPQPSGPIVTVITNPIDTNVTIYLDDTLFAEGDCEFDIIDLLDRLGVHVHFLTNTAPDGGEVYQLMSGYPQSLREALALPVLRDVHDGVVEDFSVTLASINGITI